jgi:shikimate dehydrogenase
VSWLLKPYLELPNHLTDITGILNSLGEAGCYPQGMRVVVLGAGGVARSVVFALAQAKVETVLVLNRTTERAAYLVDDLVGVFPKKSALNFAPLTTETLVDLQDDVDLVVNSTSAGMQPHYDTCPWPEDAPMPAKATFCDLVYTPLETLFLARARAAGGKSIDGLGMLVHQGAAAFEIWTGYHPPIHMMRQACLEQLEGN